MIAFLVLLLVLLVTSVSGEARSGAPSTPAPAPATLTQADSGRTVTIPRSGDVTLRLSHRWRWSEPRVEGRSVTLQRIDYLVDPGFDAWHVVPVRSGTTTITATGSPGRRFRLTVRVG